MNVKRPPRMNAWKRTEDWRGRESYTEKKKKTYQNYNIKANHNHFIYPDERKISLNVNPWKDQALALDVLTCSCIGQSSKVREFSFRSPMSLRGVFVLNLQIGGMGILMGFLQCMHISISERGSKNILFLRGKNYRIGWTCDNHVEESLIA